MSRQANRLELGLGNFDPGPIGLFELGRGDGESCSGGRAADESQENRDGFQHETRPGR